MLKQWVLGALFILCGALKGYAHPHVWVETDIILLEEGQQVRGVRVHWKFDALYSTAFLQDMDKNRNKKLDDEEIEAVIQDVFVEGQESLYPFFRMVWEGEKQLFRLEHPRIIWGEDNLLNYYFDVVLETPKPRAGAWQIAVYDPEFYVDFDLNKEIVLQAKSCEQYLDEDKTTTIYMGSVHPYVYYMTCRAAS